jgi:flagellar motility protein MotE (MotC chaperone)
MHSGLLIAVFLVILSALPASAQTAGSTDEKQSYLFEWTDSKGVVHITDSLDKVPTEHRSNMRRREAAPEEGTAPARPRQPGTAPSADSAEDQREAQEKAAWQRRMSDAKQRLAAAEQRYRELEQRRTALLGQWGTQAYAPSSARVEAERLSVEMQGVQKEIDNARNEVDVVIPEEARKAGVPPGWLRE